MASRPRQAVYKGGKWHIKKDGKWVPGDAAFQNVAWRSWRQRRGAGSQKIGPREHSVVSLSYEPSAGQWTAKDQQRQDQRDFERTHRKSDLPKKFLRHGTPSGYTVRNGQVYEQRHATDTVGGTFKATALDVVDTVAGLPTAARVAVTDPVGFAKGMATSVPQAYRERQDHPGNWLLTGLPIGAGVMGLGMRGAAGVGAARAARATGASRAASLARAVTRPGYEGGGFVRLPEPGQVPLRVGDHTEMVNLPRSPLRRPIARERVARQQASLDRGGPRELPKWAGRSIQDKVLEQFSAEARVGRLRRDRQRVMVSDRSALQKQHHAAVRKLGFHSKAEQAAINVVANAGDAAISNPWKAVHDQIKNHVDAAIEWERKAAEAPDTHPQIRRRYLRNAKENREYANRLKKAVPVLEKNPEKFQEAVRLTRLGSEYVQQGKIDRELITGDQAAIRLQRQAAAATGVRPSKLSVAAEGVDPNVIVNKVITARDRENVGTVKSVDAESGTAEVFFHNKATGRKATVTLPLDEILRKDGKLSWEGTPTYTPIVRPRTLEEARALYQRLDAAYEKKLKDMGNEMMSGRERSAEAARRNWENARRKPKGFAKRPKRVLEDLRNRAEDLLHEALKDPSVAKSDLNRLIFEGAHVDLEAMRHIVEMRDRLGAELGKLNDPEHLFGGASAAPDVNLGTVRDVRMELSRLPAAPEGAFYYPGSAKFRQGAKAKGKPNAPVASPYGISSVTTPSRQGVEGVTGKRFTGSSFDYAQPDVANVISHQLGSFARFTVMEDTLGELWNMGAKAKRTDRDIPIRDTVTIRAELRNLVQDIEKYGAEGDHKMLQSAEDALSRFLKREDDPDINAPVGTELDGVRWVDRSVVKPTTSIYKGAFKFFDVVNQPARFSTLYTRPAYILNLVGNATMGVWDHGIRRYGQSYAKAVNAKALYGRETEAWMASAMGESKSLSFAPETQAGKMTRAVAGAWNQVTDYHHRLATLIAEADRAGFKTPEAINRLRTDPGLEAKRIEIIQRARDSAVDFDNLTPIERDVLTRIIYFYPWVSRGSQWAVRAALDQPLKTLVAAQAGRIGRDEILKMFGNLGPMWQRLAGFVPIHKNKNGLIDVINASSVNTFGTAVGAGAGVVDATKGLIGLAHGKGFTDSVTPALDTFGSQFSDTPGGGGLRGILEQQPLYRIGVNAGLYGKPSKTFPETGPANAAIRWAGSGVGLTGLDPKQRETQYLREQGLSKRGPATAKLKVKDDLAEMQRKAVESGLIGKGQGLPPELRRAWSLRQRRAVALSTLKRDAEDYQRKAFEADAKLLVQMGVLSERDMRAGLAEYADASPEELSAVREKWGYQFFGGSTIRRGWKEIRDASAATP